MLQNSHLYQEIHQQPDALAALLSQERDHVQSVVNHMRSQPVTLPETLSPLVSIIPGQLFAMHLAHTRGYDVAQPRGLPKVTETR